MQQGKGKRVTRQANNGRALGRMIRQENRFAVRRDLGGRYQGFFGSVGIMSRAPTPILLFFSRRVKSKPSINPLYSPICLGFAYSSQPEQSALKPQQQISPAQPSDLSPHFSTNESFTMSTAGTTLSETTLKDVSFGPIVCYVTN